MVHRANLILNIYINDLKILFDLVLCEKDSGSPAAYFKNISFWIFYNKINQFLAKTII